MDQSSTKLLCARWVLPITSPVIEDGAVAVRGAVIEAVGPAVELRERYPQAAVEDFGQAAIMPGLINAHSHLELTVMRGFLDAEDLNFTAWLEKLTRARAERMTDEHIATSIAWGLMEAIRSGVTTVADASTNGVIAARVLNEAGLRGIVFQETFGPDPKVASARIDELRETLRSARKFESPLVTIGISPHAPYSVSAPQLALLAEMASVESLPVMMHAAESVDELNFLRDGSGRFADGLRRRGIEWLVPRCSTITHLERTGVLRTRPLLAHCVTIEGGDITTVQQAGASVAHCPKSNAKLGHGPAPLAQLVQAGVPIGLGSDSVASNNLMDLFEEARFAVFQSRVRERGTDRAGLVDAHRALRFLTWEGARALGLDGRIGSLEPSKQADITVVALNGPHQRPVYDPISALIFTTHATDVVLTMVAGTALYRDGLFATLDVSRLTTAFQTLSTILRND